ncbi:MAG TPA: FKBP-type peptidyl-prolyl cis-trans isomerase [Acidobacteriaceae bacterium]|nr:FKBP-type peptidyl-prolyl cis-trans isomerase [Acidobacteriaceae bacterium]
MIQNRAFSILLAAALPLAAQTNHPAAAAHRATTATGHREASGCVTLPELSPKIPALPAGSPCAKTLYTVTRTPTLKLDYASPLVSQGVREELGDKPETFSLDYVDTKIGTGNPIEPHKCISVQYTGYLANGTKFDSSRDRNQPIEFLYGGHRVIPGWDTGFEGMRMGGERRLFIPWQLAYGENGRGPIPPKAELIFDVEAVSQSEPRAAGGPPGSECMKTPPPQPHRPEVPPAGDAPKGATTTPPTGTTPPAEKSEPATPPPATSTPPASTQSQQTQPH